MDDTLLMVVAALSLYGYRAADYNGSGVWRLLGEIVAQGVSSEVGVFYLFSTEKDKADFMRSFDQWRQGTDV
jgi:hypothetical protein